MPINFSELVNTVEEKNKQNRRELVSQIRPFLDVLVRKSLYESEKRKAADESVTAFTELGKATGVNFAPMTGAGGKALDPKYQQMAYNAQAESQAPIKQMEAFASVFGTDLPENYNNLKPQEATLVLEKMKQDYATEQTIADVLTMYPDIAEKVSGDPRYQGGNLKLKAALVRKALGDKEAQAEFDQRQREKIADSNIRISEYQAKSNIDVSEAQRKDQVGGSASASTAGERAASNLVAMYEGSGKNYRGSKVQISRQKGYTEAVTIMNGEKIRKTSSGYSYQDQKGVWRKLVINEDGKSLEKKIGGLAKKNPVYPDAKTILDGALQEYDNYRAKAGAANQSQPQQSPQSQQTFDEFNDIF